MKDMHGHPDPSDHDNLIPAVKKKMNHRAQGMKPHTRLDRKGGGKLTAAARHALPAKDFALGGERYPINDPNHARNALARVSQHGSESEKEKVRTAVHRKYPGIGKK